MWKSLAVFTLVFSSMVTASEEQCYFNGTVDFDTSEADYAVIRISNHNGAVDSLYLYAPDDYLF